MRGARYRRRSTHGRSWTVGSRSVRRTPRTNRHPSTSGPAWPEPPEGIATTSTGTARSSHTRGRQRPPGRPTRSHPNSGHLLRGSWLASGADRRSWANGGAVWISHRRTAPVHRCRSWARLARPDDRRGWPEVVRSVGVDTDTARHRPTRLPTPAAVSRPAHGANHRRPSRRAHRSLMVAVRPGDRLPRRDGIDVNAFDGP